MSLSSHLFPPRQQTGTLDRASFTKTFPLCQLTVGNPQFISEIVKNCKHDILQIPGIPFIVKSGNQKAIVLTERLESPDQAEKVLSPDTLETIERAQGEINPYTLELGYDFWKTDEILRAILPEDSQEEIPSGFTRTGHIAHINLKQEFKPFGGVIGQVILDKNPSIKTVVDKVDTIDTVFRTFKMKVLAGEENFLVTQKESDCSFIFDFSKVYWNSRLHTEHQRLVDLFQPGDAICDVMAGVGPFAVPAAKKRCIVMANDLNPESVKFLDTNIKGNAVEPFVRSFNIDGREFISSSIRKLVEWHEKDKTIQVVPKRRSRKQKPEPINIDIPAFFSHYVMNLPDSAITFVDEYRGMFSKNFPHLTKDQLLSIQGFKLPMIHVHHFEKWDPNLPEPSEEELEKRMRKKIEKLLQCEVEEISFHLVRKVAPTKPMYCISFQLPMEVAFL